jgi:hemoglobin-like flavoprotein
MSSPVSDRTRSLLSRSLPLVQPRRDLLVERIERSFAAEAGLESSGQAELSAMMLVDLLLRQVKTLVESGQFSGLDEVAAEHRAFDIKGRHYSRFGDALVPVLRDLLGRTAPREVAAAWCDTFWAMIRATLPAEEPALA